MLTPMNSSVKPVKQSQSFRQWVLQVAIAFLVAWALQFFVLELASVRNSAMSPSLCKEDFLLISKFHYGARTPATWLKIPLTEPFIGDSIPTFLPYLQSKIFRLPGLGDIERDDVIYFNHPRKPIDLPPDMRAKFLGRCIGLPGDSVRIEYLQTAHYQEDTAQRQYAYWVSLNDSNPLEWLQRQGFTDIDAFNELYLISCTPVQAAKLMKQPAVRSMYKAVTPRGMDTEMTFPYHRFFSWNKAFLGPLWVPRKGATIALNDSTLALYDWLLEYEQGNNIRFVGTGYEQAGERKVFLAGKPTSQYTFEQNYYFVLNDNRSHAEDDSRRFGLVPESMIIGKAWLVLFSINSSNNSNAPDKRFFTTVR